MSCIKKALLEYAEKFPINDLPGYTNIVSPDSKYIRISDNALPLIGYQSQDQVYETDYYNMPCKASENAEKFQEEDKLALNQEIKILSYSYFSEWKILLGHKKPIFKNGQSIGTIAHFIDITTLDFIDIKRFLFEENKNMKRKQFSYMIQSKLNFKNLTEKEQACLFFYVRGFSYKEVAGRLKISLTTAKKHIVHIKEKFDVNNRSSLIEKVTHLGFMSVAPKSILGK